MNSGRKHAAPADLVTGSGKSKETDKHKEGKGPSSGEKRLPIRGNQAVLPTAKAGTIPDSESMTKSTGTTKEDVAAAEEKAGSHGHEGWRILHSVSKKWSAVENRGIPAVAEARPGCSPGGCSNVNIRSGSEWQHLKGNELAPVPGSSSGSSGSSGREKRSVLDASSGDESWQFVGLQCIGVSSGDERVGASNGGESLQPVSSSGASKSLPFADDGDASSSSGDESWTTAVSRMSAMKLNKKSPEKPRKQPERGTKPAAATGPPRKLSRTVANKAVKENRPVVEETELMKGSKTAAASVPQRSKSRGAKQARQTNAGSNARRGSISGNCADDDGLLS